MLFLQVLEEVTRAEEVLRGSQSPAGTVLIQNSVTLLSGGGWAIPRDLGRNNPREPWGININKQEQRSQTVFLIRQFHADQRK